jgi:hypothetical protein
MTHPHRRTAASAIGALALADAGLAAQTASAASSTVTATIPVGRSPVGVAVDPATGIAYVANDGDNTVSVIGTNARIRKQAVPRRNVASMTACKSGPGPSSVPDIPLPRKITMDMRPGSFEDGERNQGKRLVACLRRCHPGEFRRFSGSGRGRLTAGQLAG